MTEAEYFAAIQEHFAVAIGNPMYQLVGLQFAQAQQWYDGGVPLGVALRGIDEAMRGQRGKVFSLRYCDGAVRELCRKVMR